MNAKKSITISDIASLANVSKSTVSRVINDTTPVNEKKREAVLAAMKQMNFEPNVFARGLASGQSMTIGVVTQNIGSTIYDAISQGVMTGLETTGYSPIFSDGQFENEKCEASIETLIGRRIDGIIVIGSNIPDATLGKIKERLPTIVVGREIENWNNQTLFIDNEQSAFDATQHLIALGHRQIVHITGIPDHQDSIRRVNGFRRALLENDMTPDESLIIQGKFDGDSGITAVESLLEQATPFTAIFAANDKTAFGARLALYRRGIRVPEDVSIIGFDDQAEAELFTPPLTTVHQPGEEMGIAAADALLKLIKGQDYEIPQLKAEVVVRESTCRKA